MVSDREENGFEYPNNKETRNLPEKWPLIDSDFICYYKTKTKLLVSFSEKQIKLGKRYDPRGQHLRAINIGKVPPTGQQGLVPSEQGGYDYKTKILGKGGDYRFHCKTLKNNILHFPGYRTKH